MNVDFFLIKSYNDVKYELFEMCIFFNIIIYVRGQAKVQYFVFNFIVIFFSPSDARSKL